MSEDEAWPFSGSRPLNPNLPRRWRFSGVELDGGSLTLTVHGRVVEIEPKPLQVLVHLLENAGKLVTKDALIQAVWPGRIIGDAALTKCMARLREAIGDVDQRLIKTHHRYGYRLLAPVEFLRPAEPLSRMAEALAAAPVTAEPARETQDTEHRPVTIAFCDLVGSTELAETLEPERFRQLLIEYGRIASEICARYEARVAQQMGDGLLIYFGYPVAHDDDAERALRCACELVSVLTRAGLDQRVEVRIGVHSATVLIGAVGKDVLATGPGVHLASRLQTRAEPGTILTSDATLRLVPGLFVTRDFGAQSIRGIASAVRVHQVLQPSGVRSRLEAATTLTPFSGRERDIGLLLEAWRETFDGRGRAVLVSGEPGIGKSRLMVELRARLEPGSYTWLECGADALGRLTPFRPLTELLLRGLAIRDDDGDTHKQHALEQGLTQLGLDPIENLPLLAPLLSLSLGAPYPPVQLAPELLRQRTLELLVKWIVQLAQDQPTILTVEDLHWADESSLEVLDLLLTRIADQPILLLMTGRLEFVPHWAHAELRRLRLEPLASDAVEQMLGGMTQGQPFSATLCAFIHQRAGGTPLFVEALGRDLIEAGRLVERNGQLELDASAAQARTPDSLHGMLMARLDRLGHARELIQAAAVIGAECTHRQLQRVSGLDEPELQAQLARLIEAGMLHARGSAPEASYAFQHALIRDSAYAALLKSTRQALHERAASAIEHLHAARLEDHHGELAYHCEQAGQIERAAQFARQAGQRAMRASANLEALGHLAHAIRLLESLEHTPARITALLSLYVSTVNLRMAVSGYLDPALDEALRRASELARGAEPNTDLAATLFFLAMPDVMRSNHRAALETVARLDALGVSMGLMQASMVAAFLTAQASAMLGRFEDAERSARRAMALYDPETCRDVSFLYGEDLMSSGAATLAWPLWARGFPDQAAAERLRAIEYARELGHEYNLAMCCVLNAFGLHFAGEIASAARIAREGVAIAQARGFRWVQAWGEVVIGSDTARRDPAAGVDEIRRAVEVFSGGGCTLLLGWALGALAGALALAGDVEGALREVEASITFSERTGENLFLAEARRLRGELLLHAGGADDAAEECFQRALDVARSQGARSLELRAAMSAARLRLRQGRVVEAVAVLQPVHDGFSEGFDTPDLQEAAGLLRTLR